MQVPLQRHMAAAPGGAPALIDPVLYGAALRLPLPGAGVAGARGLEFVLRAGRGDWLAAGQGGNFFVDLPRV